MRIVYIASSGGPGGASVALFNLISNLNQTHEVQIVFPYRGSFSEQVEQLGITCHYIGRYFLTIYPYTKTIKSKLKFPYNLLKNVSVNYLAYRKLLSIVSKFQPDLVHTNVGPLDIGYKVAKKLKIKHVWHLREYQDLDFDMKFYPSKAKFLKLINEPFNYCVAITKGVFEYWRLNDSKAKLIYDGVIKNSNDKIICQSKEKYFLFVGRIEEAKGLDILLRVFAKFSESNKDYNLLVAGSGQGKYFDECIEFTKVNKIQDKVFFLGHRTDVDLLMAKATALVVPSRFEGFGFITVEAMNNFCLVIGKNNAGTKEQLDIGLKQKGNEIGFRFSTEEELLEKMSIACNLSASEYKEITYLAFDVVSENYTTDVHARKIELFYELILENTSDIKFCKN